MSIGGAVGAVFAITVVGSGSSSGSDSDSGSGSGNWVSVSSLIHKELLFRRYQWVQVLVHFDCRYCGRMLILMFLFLVSMVVLRMDSSRFFLLIGKGSVLLVVYCSSMNMVVVLRQSPLQVV